MRRALRLILNYIIFLIVCILFTVIAIPIICIAFAILLAAGIIGMLTMVPIGLAIANIEFPECDPYGDEF